MRVFLDGDGIIVEPASGLSDEDRKLIRANKSAVLAYLRAEKQINHASSMRDVVPDSRHPLISESVRAKIEAVEADARRLGWPGELLWSCAYWDLPRGLAAVLDPEDEIGEVTPDYIEIWKLRRDRQRFMRRIA